MCLSTSVALAVSSMVLMSKCKCLSKKPATTLVEAAAARPPFRAFVSCVSTVSCAVTLFDALGKLFGLSLL